MMEYRRLGRSNLHVSAVGFGTCQLRRVPEQQALDTLKRGFDLGVNLVHTAPDYEGADDLVAQLRQAGARHSPHITEPENRDLHVRTSMSLLPGREAPACRACKSVWAQRRPNFAIEWSQGVKRGS